MGWKQLGGVFKNNSLYLSIVVYHEYKIDHISKMYFLLSMSQGEICRMKALEIKFD